jgi:prophage antirepressor-like protein
MIKRTPLVAQPGEFAFDGQEIRAGIADNGDLYFVAADVAKVLGLENNRQALARLKENEKADVILNDGRQNRRMATVNEPGLYRLVFSSRKPSAEQFKDFVFHDILPAIRKQGGYISPDATADQIAEMRAQLDRQSERITFLERWAGERDKAERRYMSPRFVEMTSSDD